MASLRTLAREASRGAYDRRAGRVGAESGYDHTTIAPAMADKAWHCIVALSQTRRGNSAAR